MPTINFLVNAGHHTGYGHIVRCLVLARALKERGGLSVFYGNRSAVKRAKQSKEVGLEFDPDTVERFPLADVWIIDLEHGCPPRFAKKARAACRVLVILAGVGYGDQDVGRLESDLCFYQGVTRQPYQLDWEGYAGEWFEGPRWLILRPEFGKVERNIILHNPPRVVIAGGGGDPKDVTGAALLALSGLPLELRAIVGPANERDYTGYGAEIIKDPPDIVEALAWGDVAVVSYGMTVFECLALGLPTVALSISADHAASADLVERDCAALFSLGEVESVSVQGIRSAVEWSLANAETRRRLALDYQDGKGAERVVDKIIERVENVEVGERTKTG